MLYTDDEIYRDDEIDIDYYSTCYLSVVKNIKSTEKQFEFKLSIEIDKLHIKNEDEKNALITRLFKNLNLQIIENRFNYIERIYKGYFLFNLVKKIEYVDIPILKQFFTNDEFVSYFLLLNEFRLIHKKKGGEKANFYLDGYGTILFNKSGSKDKDLMNYYNDNCDSRSIEFRYDKIGSLQKFEKLVYPPTFISSKFPSADVFIISFDKINVDRIEIDHLQSIMNVLFTYMIRNKKTVIDLYSDYI
jgi:hypothetical protein